MFLEREANMGDVAEGKLATTSKSQLGLLFLAVFIDLLGFGIIIPLLPFFAVELGASPFVYTTLAASYSIMQFIFAPFWGKISDRVGRRPIILMGIFGSFIGFLLFGLSYELWMLFGSRIIAGIFTAATLTTAQAYIADSTPPQKRAAAFGMLGVAFGLGFAFGPVIGGFLSTVHFFGMSDFALPSFFAAGLSLINLLGASIWLPESLPEDLKGKVASKKHSLSLTELGRIRSYPNVALIIASFAIITFAFSGFEVIFALFANHVNSSIQAATIGYILGYVGIIVILGQGAIIRPMVSMFGEKQTILAGLILTAIGLISLTATSSLLSIFIAMTPLALGVSLSNPALNSALSKSVPRDQQGSVLGTNQGMSSLMRIVGPLFAGALFEIDYRLPFIASAALLVLVSMMLLHSLHFLETFEEMEGVQLVSTSAEELGYDI